MEVCGRYRFHTLMEKPQQAHVVLSIEAQKTLCMDVCQRPTIEACGVLLGTIDEQGNWCIEQALPLRNIFDSPVYFEFSPEELLMVELDHPGRIVGVYHSHPTGFAIASSTDRDNMQRVNKEQQIPWVWCIIKGPFTAGCGEHHQEYITDTMIMAYHHYVQEGLQQIPICLKRGEDDREPHSEV